MRKYRIRLLLLVIATSITTPLLAQLQTGQNPSFEVATVREWTPDGPGPYTSGGRCHGSDSSNGSLITIPLGRCRFSNITLSHLMVAAFGGPFSMLAPPEQLVANIPDWGNIPGLRFYVEGKAEDPKASEAQLIQMLQQLLVERFGLKYHKELRETPGFALTIAKSGLLKEAVDPSIAQKFPPPQVGTLFVPNAPIQFLTNFLSLRLGAPVEDKTGLSANYDINLRWTPDDNNEFSGGFGPGGPLPASFTPAGSLPADPNGPSLSTALREQLGLRLESQKVTKEVIVIDHVEKPTPN